MTTESLVEIPFTRYIRPNGRRSQDSVSRPKEIADKAQVLIDKGCKFTVEDLGTGMISLCVEYEGNDIGIELSENDKSVLDAVDTLINRAYEKLS